MRHKSTCCKCMRQILPCISPVRVPQHDLSPQIGIAWTHCASISHQHDISNGHGSRGKPCSWSLPDGPNQRHRPQPALGNKAGIVQGHMDKNVCPATMVGYNGGGCSTALGHEAPPFALSPKLDILDGDEARTPEADPSTTLSPGADKLYSLFLG